MDGLHYVVVNLQLYVVVNLQFNSIQSSQQATPHDSPFATRFVAFFGVRVTNYRRPAGAQLGLVAITRSARHYSQKW